MKSLLFVLVCWVASAALGYVCVLAKREGWEITGKFSIKSGDHEGSGEGWLSMIAVAVLLFVVPPGLALLNSGSDSTAAPATSTTTTGSTLAPSLGPSGVSSASPSPSAQPEYRFTTPDATIACVMRTGPDYVRCDTTDNGSWNLPLRPAECPAADWGRTLVLDATSADLACDSDRVIRNGNVLQDGTFKTFGSITCKNVEVTVTCSLGGLLGHEFIMSSASYFTR